MSDRPEAAEPLPVVVTDAHTHLGTVHRKGGPDAAAAVAEASACGVVRLVDVGYDVPSSEAAVRCADEHPEVIACVALHPTDAVEVGAALHDDLARLEALVAGSDRVRGIGETGLDHHWVKDAAGQAVQKESFAAHIALAKRYDRALVIHDRDAHDDLLAVLDAEGWPERVQFHCFSGDAAMARRCLEHGAFLSFAGNVTFKANHGLRDAARLAPADRLLVETDAPYLTPVPHRGRANRSALLPHTVRFLAAERGDDLEAFCAAVHANATALFGDWGVDG